MIEEEARCKDEAGFSRLEVEWTSLMLEIRATIDKVSSFHSQTGMDKAAMEKDYQKALELIFAYGYGWCIFKHNICSDQPDVPDDMPTSSRVLCEPQVPPSSSSH